MSEQDNLPPLIRAHCGHYVPASTKPTGRDQFGAAIVLCPPCKAAISRPSIEKK